MIGIGYDISRGSALLGHEPARGLVEHFLHDYVRNLTLFGVKSRQKVHRAATPAISTRNFGLASLASTVARAGLPLGSTHASHAAFISS
jgi:hypothetical protein